MKGSLLRDNLGFIRMAHVLGIAVWVVFGLMAQLVLQGDAGSMRADLILRYGFALPIATLALALTWAPWYPRRWPWMIALADVFTRFDLLASRMGLEKIKTVGDAYMVVAGAPEPCEDPRRGGRRDGARHVGVDHRQRMARRRADADPRGHGERAGRRRGDRPAALRLRPVGRHGQPCEPPRGHRRPGKVLVADTTYTTLRDRYVFSDPIVLQLKGKGPTSARFLLGRQQPGLIG